MDGRKFPSFQRLPEGREEISEVKDCLGINPQLLQGMEREERTMLRENPKWQI